MSKSEASSFELPPLPPTFGVADESPEPKDIIKPTTAPKKLETPPTLKATGGKKTEKKHVAKKLITPPSPITAPSAPVAVVAPERGKNTEAEKAEAFSNRLQAVLAKVEGSSKKYKHEAKGKIHEVVGKNVASLIRTMVDAFARAEFKTLPKDEQVQSITAYINRLSTDKELREELHTLFIPVVSKEDEIQKASLREAEPSLEETPAFLEKLEQILAKVENATFERREGDSTESVKSKDVAMSIRRLAQDFQHKEFRSFPKSRRDKDIEDAITTLSDQLSEPKLKEDLRDLFALLEPTEERKSPLVAEREHEREAKEPAERPTTVTPERRKGGEERLDEALTMHFAKVKTGVEFLQNVVDMPESSELRRILTTQELSRLSGELSVKVLDFILDLDKKKESAHPKNLMKFGEEFIAAHAIPAGCQTALRRVVTHAAIVLLGRGLGAKKAEPEKPASAEGSETAPKVGAKPLTRAEALLADLAKMKAEKAGKEGVEASKEKDEESAWERTKRTFGSLIKTKDAGAPSPTVIPRVAPEIIRTPAPEPSAPARPEKLESVTSKPVIRIKIPPKPVEIPETEGPAITSEEVEKLSAQVAEEENRAMSESEPTTPWNLEKIEALTFEDVEQLSAEVLRDTVVRFTSDFESGYELGELLQNAPQSLVETISPMLPEKYLTSFVSGLVAIMITEDVPTGLRRAFLEEVRQVLKQRLAPKIEQAGGGPSMPEVGAEERIENSVERVPSRIARAFVTFCKEAGPAYDLEDFWEQLQRTVSGAKVSVVFHPTSAQETYWLDERRESCLRCFLVTLGSENYLLPFPTTSTNFDMVNGVFPNLKGGPDSLTTEFLPVEAVRNGQRWEIKEKKLVSEISKPNETAEKLTTALTRERIEALTFDNMFELNDDDLKRVVRNSSYTSSGWGICAKGLDVEPVKRLEYSVRDPDDFYERMHMESHDTPESIREDREAAVESAKEELLELLSEI